MAFKDLRDYLEALDKRGELKRIRVEVSPDLEITEITDRMVKAGGPTLFFERVKGHQIPVVTNLFGTWERTKFALNSPDIDARGEELASLLQPDLPTTLWDKLKSLPKLAEISSWAPRLVRRAPCQEVVVENPDLTWLPALKCWPKDGGRFITLPLVITKDPETGKRNMGMYRMQIFDATTTGMHWHRHKDAAEHYRKAEARGERLPVAVALGTDPATIYAATAPLPFGMDEFLLAGFLRREPVELVRCVTQDLEVPANAEIVLEGYVEPGERRLEGPFGDHTGFYSPADYYPVFHVTCITHRRNPIYPATIVGKPIMEDAFLAKATERLFLPLLRLQLPEIVDMCLPVEGVVHNCLVVSIRKRYPGQAKKVMHALWGLGQIAFTKLIVVVDEEVNVHDPREVWWRVFSNVDPRRDLLLSEGPLDELDHSSPRPAYGAKLGIDATRKGPEEGHPRPWPEEIAMSPEIKALVDRKWKEYGF
ncbi:menaquinone biosynthesis decarboxylase [Ammonifex thiophilus]|uniref:Phenolic acid decarboxylase n=1 Tax=Ammonifex thiophilus TaxID=444093 RepID=A0A3D8P5D6_9THEO|nr:menaquinone biosynthesis decarboxylase [Ammonifex thiophilus]RDV83433.1 menaquinone biosynthesis decarboxylase [Ammonifex thiophilus]